MLGTNEDETIVPDRYTDGALILGMVVPRPDDGAFKYSCRFFVDGNCSIYESRPAMCRHYPYGRRCEHGDRCAWSVARTGNYPQRTPYKLPVIQSTGQFDAGYPRNNYPRD